ncbi:hypothetical protein LTR78_008899 [Recurvomyces mirabilis]|uniref:Endosomal/vacuolar adapter protein YPT35 n=1 Tax=Recurvomyces mirabilis TaxID=574656 RepID=A0AAE0TPB6_9PEZI|nr:hypothetical protein LTR78_008899 [Recurvomyces mirabilis]KAK5155814.1 PX domain-containing protein ypt35 [Recurvomyces mirabilis]
MPPPPSHHAELSFPATRGHEHDKSTTAPRLADPIDTTTAAVARVHMQDKQQKQQLDAVLGDGSANVPDAPPYWTSRNGRTLSYHSITGHQPHAILLEDHSEDHHEASQGCWARSVSVDDYTIIAGPSGVGAYVVWHCTVGTLKGGDMEIRKRYSEFDQLRTNLVESFPYAEAMIPKLPRKSVVSRFRPKFLEQRKTGLGEFMNCILLNPEFAASPVLKGFIFAT